MAHSLSAKKRVRQTLKRRARNRARKEALKEQVKGYLTVLGTRDFKKAELELRKVTKRLDQVASKGTIHKNTASRRRSRLVLRLNAARKAGTAPAAA